jgi:hypothetical protein
MERTIIKDKDVFKYHHKDRFDELKDFLYSLMIFILMCLVILTVLVILSFFFPKTNLNSINNSIEKINIDKCDTDTCSLLENEIEELNAEISNKTITLCSSNCSEYNASFSNITSNSITSDAFTEATTNTNLPILQYANYVIKTVVNTALETSILDPNGSVGLDSIYSNKLNIGTVIKISMNGFYSTYSANTFITFAIKLNSDTILITPNKYLPVNMTNKSWYSNCNFKIGAIGTNGNINGQCVFVFEIENSPYPINYFTTNYYPVTINTSLNQLIDVTVKWNIANILNTISITNFDIVLFN